MPTYRIYVEQPYVLQGSYIVEAPSLEHAERTANRTRPEQVSWDAEPIERDENLEWVEVVECDANGDTI